MATAKKAAAKKAAPKKQAAVAASSAAPGAPDAIKLLTTDHREVKALFQQYQALVDHEAEDEEKQPIAQQICMLLTVHAQIEEEIFYPAARQAQVDDDLLDEAEVEHSSAKDLIAQIQGMDPDEELYDAKVTVLGEFIDHHVQEEEGEMFPKCRKAKMDLAGLAGALAGRKTELMGDEAQAAA